MFLVVKKDVVPIRFLYIAALLIGWNVADLDQ